MSDAPMNLNEVDTEDLVAMLRHVSVETGSLTCLGCGHEHNCGTRGCALIREAADRLDTMQREWVSVEERLPEEKQRVIVRCERVGTSVGWILWGNWMTDIGPGAGKVTHWMPLPAPPETKEEANATN